MSKPSVQQVRSQSDPLKSGKWLFEFRWAMFVAQLIATIFVFAMPMIPHSREVPFLPLGLLFCGMAVSNLVLQWYCQRSAEIAERWIVGILTFDVVLLTVLFTFSGWAANPFTLLYLAEICLSLVVIGFWHSLPILLLSNLGFFALFLSNNASVAHSAHLPIESHLIGMFLAFLLTSFLIAFFLKKTTQQRELYRENVRQLEKSREEQLRLAILTSLATQTAHEFGTPLGTIMLVIDGLSRRLAENVSERDAKDLQLLSEQAKQLKSLLNQMVWRGGTLQGEFVQAVSTSEIVTRLQTALVQCLPDNNIIAVQWDQRNSLVLLPIERFLQAVVSLCRNSLNAQAKNVEIALRTEEHQFHLSVVDDGGGMTKEMLQKIGQPFLHDFENESGVSLGMGLGLFVVKLLCKQCGGQFLVSSTLGVGTRVTLSFDNIEEERLVVGAV